MNFKKCIIFIVLIVFLFSIASVSAADMNETATTSTDEYEIELSQNDEKEITGQNENSKLESGNTGTFSELQNSINNNYGQTLKLNKSYECEDGFSSGGIVITGPITIDGQGCTIDAKEKARIFHVKSENVIIKNIIFINGKTNGDGGAIYFEKTGTAINCTFNNNTARYGGGAMDYGSAVNCTFTGNTANMGGAMADGSAVNCTFTSNTATWGGAMRYGSVVDCTFNGNQDGVGDAMRDGYYKNWMGIDSYSASKELILSFDMGNFTSTYGSNKGLFIKLINQNRGRVDFIDVEVIIYKNNAEILRMSGLSGVDLILDLAAGNYIAQLNVTDPGLTADSKNITLTINKATPKIEVQAYDATYPGDVVVNVKSDVAGLYVVKIGDKTQNVTLKANIEQNVTFTGLSANEEGYVINATHNSENYTGFNDTVKVSVNKATPKIEVHADDATYPGDVVVSVKSDVAGLYVVKIGDKTQNVTLKANIEHNVTFAGLAANEEGYIVNVTNTDLENCTASVNDTVKVFVGKATPKIEVQAYDTTYPGDVVVSVKSDVAGLYVVKVGDVSQNITLKANNSTNITFAGLSANEEGYVVNVTNADLENCTLSVNDTVKVFVSKATPVIEVRGQDATYPDDVVITVKSNIAGLYVVSVGDVSQNVTLEAGVERDVFFEGLAVNEEGYVVNVTNADLENCTLSVNDSAVVKVMKASSYINTDGLITVYNSGGVLFVSLTGVDGVPLSGRGIKVNITGKTYTIITNASGIAGLPINLKAGLHPAYVWFNGDSTYAPSENLSTSVEVYTDSRITGNKDLVKKQGGSEPFKVRALDKYGKPVGAYAKVKMTVAGKTYTVNTDAKGYASLPINLKAGKYKITTSYGGTTVTNTITVKK